MASQINPRLLTVIEEAGLCASEWVHEHHCSMTPDDFSAFEYREEFWLETRNDLNLSQAEQIRFRPIFHAVSVAEAERLQAESISRSEEEANRWAASEWRRFAAREPHLAR